MTPLREQLDAIIRERNAEEYGVPAWGLPLNDEEWDLLETRGYVAKLAVGKLTPDRLCRRVLEERRAHNPHARAPRQAGPSRQRRRSRESQSAQQAALSDIYRVHLERDARDRCGVRAFRHDVLNDQPVGNLRAWIEGEVRSQGRPTVEAGRAWLLAIRVDDEIVRRATTRGGTLDRLRQVSEALADFYGWGAADAAAYVLNRRVPPLAGVRGDVRLKWPLAARSKIVLTIDPTTTPTEVAAAYSYLRKYQFKRVRRLDAKHAALAAFVTRRARLRPETQFAEWNRRHARWRYPFLSVFTREAALAFAAITELQPHRARR